MNLWRAFTSLGLVVSLAIAAQAQYVQVNLVSDGPAVNNAKPALRFDPNLVNPWGIAFSPTGPFWIANNGTSTSTVYDSTGQSSPPSAPTVVKIPGSPTGIVFNGGGGFMIEKNGKRGSSRFIFVTEDGTIAAWNPSVDPQTAVLVNTLPSSVALYKGVALAAGPTGPLLYATNFRAGTVDVFNSKFAKVGWFTDPMIPPDFSPFGIQNVNGFLVVTYAKVDDEREDDVPGVGNGFVDLFTPTGQLVRRLASHGNLNSPWGIALAPKNFGPFSGNLLVGNFGDGKINALSLTGKFNGVLRNPAKAGMPWNKGKTIVIPGLWGLTFGNGHMGGDVNKLYFTAGSGDEMHGLFGYLKHGN